MTDGVRLTQYSHGAGCACKLDMTELEHVLRHVPTESSDPDVLIGLAAPDDSAVYRIDPQRALVQTVDFFTPVVDDPYDWGRIAAANALSDVYAMGGRPVIALNLVAWPRALDFELLGRVLEGSADICRSAGVSLLGGHSVDDPEPKYGLAVTGFVEPEGIVHKRGVQPGDDLVLTKPLGMGIVTTALKEGHAPDEVVADAVSVMTTLNAAAAEVMVAVGVRAATDVTGFGLMGHLLQMLDGMAGAEIDFEALPILEGTLELAQAGSFPGGSRRNMEASGPHVETGALDEPRRMVLFDAQTSGGLLMAVDPARSEVLLAALQEGGVDRANVIGHVVDGPAHVRVIP